MSESVCKKIVYVQRENISRSGQQDECKLGRKQQYIPADGGFRSVSRECESMHLINITAFTVLLITLSHVLNNILLMLSVNGCLVT